MALRVRDQNGIVNSKLPEWGYLVISVSLSVVPKYIYNPITLLYEEHKAPKYKRVLARLVFLLLCVGVAALYLWLYLGVLKFELPKTLLLKQRLARWEQRVDLMNARLDLCEQALTGVEQRDDDVYRSIYGLNPIPDDIKNSGIEGVNRYTELDAVGANFQLRGLAYRIDALAKRVYLRSQSLDEMGRIASEAGEMIACVPSVPPMKPDPRLYRISSRFGGREDPIYGGHESHGGVDFSMKKGTPVYAPGDGVVEVAQYNFGGYGRELVIDHGYGYKTRYAHLNTIEVVQGMKVTRGDKIGTVGSTGKSTGAHLHYEVIYKGVRRNPLNYLDLNMPLDEYTAMIDKRRSESPRDKRSSTMDLLKRVEANR